MAWHLNFPSRKYDFYDHNSWFLYEKIIRSLIACGAADVPSQPPNAKVAVMSQSNYLRKMPESVISLNDAGLCLDPELFRWDLTTRQDSWA